MSAAHLFHARHAMGRTVRGIALVANDGFSARYDLDRVASMFSRPAHKLAGRSYIDRILVLDTAKGGVASAWMLHEIEIARVEPARIRVQLGQSDPRTGRRLRDLPMLAGFDVDITGAIADGCQLEIDPATRTLHV